MVSGIKRHLAVDSREFPHLLRVTTANVSDKARGDGDAAFRQGPALAGAILSP